MNESEKNLEIFWQIIKENRIVNTLILLFQISLTVMEDLIQLKKITLNFLNIITIVFLEMEILLI